MEASFYKCSCALALGIAATAFDKYVPIIVCVLIAIILDTITGLVKCKALGIAITSKRGTRGFWKKLGLICGLFLGLLFDFFLPVMLSVVSVTLPFQSPIGLVIGCYIVLNEMISICENLNAINPSIVPRWIQKLLEGASDKIDKGDGQDGNLQR